MIDLDQVDPIAYFGSDGNCMSIALALHLITGWPIYRVRQHKDPAVKVGHVFVKSPKGYLDFGGLGAERHWSDEPSEIRSAHDWAAFDGLEESESREPGVRGTRLTVELAIPLAKALLERHFPGETFRGTFAARF
jgi:hypothetical protein